MGSPAKGLFQAVACLGIGVLGFLAVQGPVLAQSDSIEEATDKRLERELQLDVAIQKASQTAKPAKGLDVKAEVSFADVLADPDNLELNFRYAKTQVAEGNLTGASATLERILMIKPDIPSVRLFLALVYFHLDNLDESEREFNTLRSEKVTADQKAQIDDYLKQIHKRRRSTSFVNSLSVGWGYDTNRNAAASSKRRMFLDAPLPLTGTSKKRDDTNVTVVNSLSFVHDLGYQEGHKWTGSLNYYLGEQTEADDLDLQSFSVDTGLSLNTRFATFTPGISSSYLYLSRESYMRSQGLRLGANKTLTQRWSAGTSASWTREDYLPLTENNTARQRNGNRYNWSFSNNYTLSPTMLIGAVVGIEGKKIKGPTNFNAYESYSVTTSHTWLLGKGQFLLSMLTLGVKGYDEPDTSISARTRRDEELRARITYGLPMSLVMGFMPDMLVEDLTATVSLEQSRTLSNITNYTYSNSKFGVLFSKRVEF